MLHVLVKWSNENSWDVYPLRHITDPAIGIQLSKDPLGALRRLHDVAVDVVWKAGETPAPAKILAVGSRPSMERKRTLLADAAKANEDSPGVGSEQQVDIGEGVEVDEGTLARIKGDAKGSGSKFARCLLRALFTQEEYTGKSLFGRKSNAHKNMDLKEALDPLRVNAIIDKQLLGLSYLQKVFDLVAATILHGVNTGFLVCCCSTSKQRQV